MIEPNFLSGGNRTPDGGKFGLLTPIHVCMCGKFIIKLLLPPPLGTCTTWNERPPLAFLGQSLVFFESKNPQVKDPYWFWEARLLFLSPRPEVLKLESIPEAPRKLVKTQSPRPSSQSF